MPFADVFSGFEQAASDHYSKLLEMQYGQRRDAAAYLAKLADDDRFDEPSKMALKHRSLDIIGGDPMKPLSSKDTDLSSILVQPPAPPPVRVPGGQGAQNMPIGQQLSGPAGQVAAPQQPPSLAAIQGGVVPPISMPQAAPQAPALPSVSPNTGPSGQITGQTIQAPTPPPHPVQMLPYSQQIGRREQLSAADIATKTQGEQDEIRARMQTFSNLYPNMDPEVSAMLAAKMPLGSILGTTPVQDVPGKSIELPTDAFGHPIDPTETYTVLHNKLGQAVSAYPKNPGIVGGMHWALNDRDQWVGYTTDRFGKIDVRSNLGLTPPQGVPIDTIHHDIRILPTPDGGFKPVPITTESQRTRGPLTQNSAAPQVAPPTPPPGGGVSMTQGPTPEAIQTLVNANKSWGMTPQQASQILTEQQQRAGSAPPQQVAPPTPPQTGTPTNAQGEIPGVGVHLNREQVMQTREKGAALTNTVERLSNVVANADLLRGFQGLINAGKLEFALDSSKTKLLVARATGMSPQLVALAKDYASLAEDINVLRTVYGISGARGQPAFTALQLQKGSPLGNIDVFKGVLGNTIQSVIDQMVPMNEELTRAKQPLPYKLGIAKAYLVLNGMDRAKADAAAVKSGWDTGTK